MSARAAVEQAQESAGDPVASVHGCDERPDLSAAVEPGGGVGRQQGEEQILVRREAGTAYGVHHGVVPAEGRGLRGGGPGDDGEVRDGVGESLKARHREPVLADPFDSADEPGRGHGDALPLGIGHGVPPPVALVDGAFGVVGAAEHAVGESHQGPPLVEQVRERGAVVDAVHTRETGQPVRL
ncbi:hypothetical protein [Streptomyces sp. P9-2]|uniref:hypothetical protein n=1 Tax=Streptomyces sp. P9-2 TaxID=3423201 RepID=UPI003F74A5C7